MKNYKFILFITILLLICQKIFTNKIKIIYDSDLSFMFPKNLSNYYNNNNYNNNNIDLVELSQNTNLMNLTKFQLQLQTEEKEDEDKNITLFSFTSLSVFRTFKFNARVQQIPFETSLSKLETSLKNKLNHDCLLYTKDYENAVISLIYSIFMKGVAIIGDDTYCSRKFIKQIYKILRDGENISKINLNIHVVHYSKKYELTNAFYTLRTAEVNLIVLLTSQIFISTIISEAETFGLLDATHIWLIPKYYDGMMSSNIPTRILRFSLETANVFDEKSYGNLETTVPKLIRSFENMRNETLKDEESYLYQILTENEHQVSTSLDISLSYRNLIDNNSWVDVNARWTETEFLVEQNTIPILRSLSGDAIRRFMRVVTVLDSPFTVEVASMYDSILKTCKIGVLCRKPIRDSATEIQEYENTCCVGFVVEFFQKVMGDLNLEVDMYIVADGNYGAFKQGRWDGMIGDIHEGKADIAIAGLTITRDRSEVVDFTVPFMESHMGILVKPEIVELKFINWDFMAPLQTELQLALWVVIVGAMLANYLFENNLYSFSLTNEKYVKEKYYPTFESMSYISGVTLQRDLGGKNPIRPGARISAVVFAFGMVIVVTTYTAVLAAQSVQNQEKDPFLGSKDVRMRNPTDEFRFAILKSSSYETFFLNSESDVLRRMGRFMEKYNVETTEEGFEKVRNGSLNAYISDYPYLFYYLSKDRSCQLHLVSDTLLVTGLSFAIQKIQPYKKIINEIMLKHLELDVLVELQKKWYSSVCQPSIFATDNVKLTINHFGGLVLLLFATVLLSAPLLLPEYIYYKYLRNFITNRVRSIFRRQRKKSIEKTSANLGSTLVTDDNSIVSFNSMEPSYEMLRIVGFQSGERFGQEQEDEI